MSEVSIWTMSNLLHTCAFCGLLLYLYYTFTVLIILYYCSIDWRSVCGDSYVRARTFEPIIASLCSHWWFDLHRLSSTLVTACLLRKHKVTVHRVHKEPCHQQRRPSCVTQLLFPSRCYSAACICILLAYLHADSHSVLSLSYGICILCLTRATVCIFTLIIITITVLLLSNSQACIVS